jgi:hypothetical protein
MRINSTGVGIGTTSPSQKLDVAGSTKIQGNIQLTGQATGYETSFNGSSIYSAASTFNGESSMFGALVLQSRADSGRPIVLVTGATLCRTYSVSTPLATLVLVLLVLLRS